MFIRDQPDGGRRTILLTGGRAPCTLELARSFHAAGHRVLAAESVRHHLCRVSRAVERSFPVPPPNGDTDAFLEALEAIVIQERVDVLVPACEEIFHIARGVDRLRRLCFVWAAPLQELRELHDKWRFASLARRLGLTVPETRLVQSREEWLALADGDALRESLVLKPAYSRFASRVLFVGKAHSVVERRRVLTEAMPALSPEAPWVAQRRIEGRHLCTYSIAYEGELIAHAAYPCRYRIGSGATVFFEPLRHAASLEWVRALVGAIGFTGQIAVDFIEEENGGLYALECNPRATSGVHLYGGDGDGRLVQAFLQPEALRNTGVMVEPGQDTGSMLTVPMLAAGLGGIRSFRQLREWIRDVHAARDVVFDRADMKPGIEQLRVLWEMWRTGRAHGVTLVQATTIDLEWNGDA